MTSSTTSTPPVSSTARAGSGGAFRHLLTKIGPLAVVGSLIVSWPAFAGATGEDGNVAFGLWVGAASILLMSWSFLLALRPKVLEPLFGGLDSMYKVHRWAGAVSVAFMFLHTSIEPEIDGGIRGAARSLAESAEELAGVGEVMIYVLIGLSVLRLFPYRWWRLTHKLLGIPFAFACFHFFTAEKPYANNSSWGWWFGTWMVVGVVAFLARVVGKDMVDKGHRYRVAVAEHYRSADAGPGTTRLILEPVGRPLNQHAGQFAFMKLDVPGMSEPHPFTIASSPNNDNLEFYIRHLGDWSAKLPDTDLVGASAHVEGPYGMFEPLGGRDEPVLWVAGGVGITPFLAAIDSLAPATPGVAAASAPVLLYATRSTEAERAISPDPIIDELKRADKEGRIRLNLFTPDTGRLSTEELDRLFPGGLKGYHVALCGPTGLVKSMSKAANRLGAARVETEDFDIRGGVGPDRITKEHVAKLPDRVTKGLTAERVGKVRAAADQLSRSGSKLRNRS